MLELEELWILVQGLVLMKSQPKPKMGRVVHLIPDQLALLQNLGASDNRYSGARDGGVWSWVLCDLGGQILSKGTQALDFAD